MHIEMQSRSNTVHIRSQMEYVYCLVVFFEMLICFGLFLIWTFLDRGAVWGHCGNSRM